MLQGRGICFFQLSHKMDPTHPEALLQFGPTDGNPSLRFRLCPEIRNVCSNRAWAANDHLIVTVLLHHYFVSFPLVHFHFLDKLDNIGHVPKAFDRPWWTPSAFLISTAQPRRRWHPFGEQSPHHNRGLSLSLA